MYTRFWPTLDMNNATFLCCKKLSSIVRNWIQQLQGIRARGVGCSNRAFHLIQMIAPCLGLVISWLFIWFIIDSLFKWCTFPYDKGLCLVPCTLVTLKQCASPCGEGPVFLLIFYYGSWVCSHLATQVPLLKKSVATEHLPQKKLQKFFRRAVPL